MDDQSTTSTSPASEPEKRESEGFSTVEKLAGAAAAYKAPLLSSIAASAMLHDETDPVKREQLTRWRTASMAWLAVGVVGALIGLVIVVSMISGRTGASSKCEGGAMPIGAQGTSYYSTDDKNWTARVPCWGGGFTEMPAPPGSVPGG